jgi:hypothetical protein
MHFLEISVMEQRYQAVMAVVQDGWNVTDVAVRLCEVSSRLKLPASIRSPRGSMDSPTGTTSSPSRSTIT